MLTEENLNLIGEETARFIENYSVRIGNDLYTSGENEGRKEGTVEIKPDGVMYSAISDDRVCEICEALDGMVIDLREPDGYELYDKYSPQLHENCRCMYIDLLPDHKFEGDNEGFDDKLKKRFFEKNPEMKEILNDDILEIMQKTARFNFVSRAKYWSQYPGYNSIINKDIAKQEERIRNKFEKQLAKETYYTEPLFEESEE